jgi:hypothetical protein
MFTGIVTDVGRILSVTPGGSTGDRRFVVQTKHDLAKPRARRSTRPISAAGKRARASTSNCR